MNDLISRQAAIDALDGEIEITGRTNAEAVKGYVRLVKDRLERLPSAQPEPGWIPVSERLPEFDELVLAWVENKDPNGRFNRPGVHTAQLRDKKPEHDPEGKKNIWGIPGYDSEWTVWAWSYFSEPDVKAWMPLPEPYEEENNERV